METITLLGVVGTTTILASFLLIQFGKWSAESRSYDTANAIGSAILILYAYLLGSIPFIILNLVWFLVSARDIIVSFRKK